MADPGPAREGDRAAWASRRTSFDWDTIRRDWHGELPPGWGRAAGAALATADAVIGELGRPVGPRQLQAGAKLG